MAKLFIMMSFHCVTSGETGLHRNLTATMMSLMDVVAGNCLLSSQVLLSGKLAGCLSSIWKAICPSPGWSN